MKKVALITGAGRGIGLGIAKALAAEAERVGARFDPWSAVTVSGEPRALARMVCNLLENALRHTPEGGTVRVVASPVPDCVLVQVCDSGEGISEGDLPHVFERFYRADKARTTRGAGLGLPVARKIIEIKRRCNDSDATR